MKKKLLSLMVVMSLVVSMTLGVTGCGSKSSDSDKKVLKVAFECAYAPYNWTQESPEVGNGKQAVKIKNADGYAYGYEVELAQRIADELGYELEVYKIEWSSILMGLQDGSYDAVMTGVCYSPERDETYDFSTPYYKRQIVGVVRADSEYANYTKLSQFAGKNTKLTTQIATNYVPYKDEVPGGVIATDYETSSECFLAVQNKTADMVILDYTTSISALSTMNNLKMLNLDFTEPEGASNDCCIVFREGDPMRDTVQEGIIHKGKGNINIAKIAEEVGYNQRYLDRVFKEAVGVSMKKYAEIIRIQKAIYYLQNSLTYEIYERLGYYDQAHFIKDFKKNTSLTPSRFERANSQYKIV